MAWNFVRIAAQILGAAGTCGTNIAYIYQLTETLRDNGPEAMINICITSNTKHWYWKYCSNHVFNPLLVHFVVVITLSLLIILTTYLLIDFLRCPRCPSFPPPSSTPHLLAPSPLCISPFECPHSPSTISSFSSPISPYPIVSPISPLCISPIDCPSPRSPASTSHFFLLFIRLLSYHISLHLLMDLLHLLPLTPHK